MAWFAPKPAGSALAFGWADGCKSGGSRSPRTIEDIAWVVIDTPQVTLTTSLISACMDAGVSLITTDAQHLPSGITLPYHRHHRQADVANLQLQASLPLRKRLWQMVVHTKITNQAKALELCTGNSSPLHAMVHLVGSGDPDNVEARAARGHWGRLFRGFVRERSSDKRNMLLNYGYAVMRSGIARAATASGLIPSIGINHASSTNAFNLADDLVEPFRPFVDRLVWQMSDHGTISTGEPSVDERRQLAGILLESCTVGTEQVTLLVASEWMSESLVRAMETGSAAMLQTPDFLS